jgi:hypothetical protein
MYVFPTPLPLPVLHDSIHLEDLSDELRDIFRQIGYDSDEDLRADLSTDKHTIAKNFYRILKADLSWDSFEWKYEVGNRGAIESTGNGFSFTPGTSSLGWGSSFGKATMFAAAGDSIDGSVLQSRVICSEGSPNSDRSSHEIYFSVPLEWMMMAVQDFLTGKSFAWFHPDESTVLARRAEPQMDLELHSDFDLSAQLRLKASLRAGDNMEFEQIVADLRDWIQEIVAPE